MVIRSRRLVVLMPGERYAKWVTEPEREHRGFWSELPAGSVVLTPEQMKRIEGMAEQADRSAFALPDGPKCDWHRSRAAAIRSVLSIVSEARG